MMAEFMERRVSVRRAAVGILTGADEEGRFVDEVLAARLGEYEAADRRLLQEITYGAVRHQNTLDRLLKAYLKVPVSKQRPHLRWALRVGAYQLVYLARIPAHAAVNQTLEGIKGIDGVTSREVGFVNAVLHNLVDDVHHKTGEEPAVRDDPTILPTRGGYCHFKRPVLPLYRLGNVEHLSFKYSHPRWLVDRWLGRYGEEECRRLFEANNRIPLTTARLTRLAPSREAVLEKLRGEGFEVEEGPLEETLILLRSGGLANSEALEDGWFQIQDFTAIELGRTLAPPPGARVLDLCAAPGGKAGQLLEAVGPEGHLVAADRSEEKLARVRENLERLGGNFTLVKVPENPEEIRLEEQFSHVLVDAPCTNTGVLARRPDARWRLRKRDLAQLANLQSRLLDAAVRHLAPGGRLLYATCSIEPEENEDQVAACVGRHPELTELRARFFLPHRTEGDGGFCSLLLRGK